MTGSYCWQLGSWGGEGGAVGGLIAFGGCGTEGVFWGEPIRHRPLVII